MIHLRVCSPLQYCGLFFSSFRWYILRCQTARENTLWQWHNYIGGIHRSAGRYHPASTICKAEKTLSPIDHMLFSTPIAAVVNVFRVSSYLTSLLQPGKWKPGVLGGLGERFPHLSSFGGFLQFFAVFSQRFFFLLCEWLPWKHWTWNGYTP